MHKPVPRGLEHRAGGARQPVNEGTAQEGQDLGKTAALPPFPHTFHHSEQGAAALHSDLQLAAAQLLQPSKPPWHPAASARGLLPSRGCKGTALEPSTESTAHLAPLQRRDEVNSSTPSSACDLLWQEPSLATRLPAHSAPWPGCRVAAPVQPGLVKAAGGTQHSLKELELCLGLLLRSSAAQLCFSGDGFLQEGLISSHRCWFPGSAILAEVQIISTGARKLCASSAAVKVAAPCPCPCQGTGRVSLPTEQVTVPPGAFQEKEKGKCSSVHTH